jgi:hypothetical protein
LQVDIARVFLKGILIVRRNDGKLEAGRTAAAGPPPEERIGRGCSVPSVAMFGAAAAALSFIWRMSA